MPPPSPVPSLFQALRPRHALFLANPTLAKVTVCVFEVWVSFPFMMLMCFGRATAVDHTVYEAAWIDGASSWRQFWQITLPLIARSTYIAGS